MAVLTPKSRATSNPAEQMAFTDTDITDKTSNQPLCYAHQTGVLSQTFGATAPQCYTRTANAKSRCPIIRSPPEKSGGCPGGTDFNRLIVGQGRLFLEGIP